MGELEVRIRKLELEKEMKKRETKNKNVIIRGMVVKKEEMERLREKAEEIVRATETVGRMEGIRKVGRRREKIWCG